MPAKYGGFETLVENLLGDEGFDITVYCSGSAYRDRRATYKGARLKYIPLRANGPQSVPYDIFSIAHAVAAGHKTVVVLGVSGAVILPLIKRLFAGVKVIVNIDGLEWRRDKWGKFAKRFLRYSERLAVRYGDVVISDNQAIADYVSEEYGRESTVIPYGGDHALAMSKKVAARDYAFGLCRIEPENNVHTILEAFSGTGRHLKFVGNWDDSEYGRDLRRAYSGIGNIQLLDPVYDIEELYELRAGSGYYVHGHSAGGTNPSLVEMMHFAKPVLAFDCTYNRSTMENCGQYFSDAEDLKALVIGDSLSDSGPQLAEIAARRYTWQIVRRQYFDLFA